MHAFLLQKKGPSSFDVKFSNSTAVLLTFNRPCFQRALIGWAFQKEASLVCA